MASILFPTPTVVGETFTEPTNGNVYICSSVTPPVWWGSIATGNLDQVYLRLNAANDPMTGNVETLGIAATGQVSGTVQSITTNVWDLSLGNFWTAAAVAIPQPTNGVAGQSGMLTLTAVPTSWPNASGTLKYTGGTAPVITQVPAVIPFFVQAPNSVLLGIPTQNIT